MEIKEKGKIIKDAGWKQVIFTTPVKSIDPVLHAVFKDPKTGEMKNLDDALAIQKTRQAPVQAYAEPKEKDKSKKK